MIASATVSHSSIIACFEMAARLGDYLTSNNSHLCFDYCL